MNTAFRPSSNRPAPFVLAIAGLCALLEVAFTLADSPLLDFPGLRQTAMVLGAFWPRLLQDWLPVYPGQPAAMFVTYAFLHANFMHMLFNMLILLHLGREAVARLGQSGFVLAYLVCAAGGAATFYAFDSSGVPMLGASGAVFGFFGTSVFWDVQARRARGLSLSQPLRLTLGLVVMNLLLLPLVGGMLAWQAHLGGFVTGLALAWVVTPAPTDRHRPDPGNR